MKIGLLVRSQTPDVDLLDELGFASCQLLIRPGQSESRTIRAEIDRIRASGVQVSALGHYGNPLDPEVAARRAVVTNLRRMIDIAGAAGVSVVGSFAGRDPERSVEDNLPAFRRVWRPLIARAEDRDVTVAIENCPMFHGHPFRGSNFAFTPSAWDLMFEAIPSDCLALEYDPSHLVCLQIDYLQVVRDYGHKIAHVHAKDAQVLWHNVRRDGILDEQASRHRMPGLGDVNWRALVSTLVEHGYRGPLDIEGRHDPVFSGEREAAGLRIAKQTLHDALGER
jgi:sugar phosphate isomerase/epimerase